MMHRHNNTSGGLPGEPKRANALILKGTIDNPFLTPPEAFVKDYLDLYQPYGGHENCCRSDFSRLARARYR